VVVILAALRAFLIAAKFRNFSRAARSIAKLSGRLCRSNPFANSICHATY